MQPSAPATATHEPQHQRKTPYRCPSSLYDTFRQNASNGNTEHAKTVHTIPTILLGSLSSLSWELPNNVATRRIYVCMYEESVTAATTNKLSAIKSVHFQRGRSKLGSIVTPILFEPCPNGVPSRCAGEGLADRRRPEAGDK